MWKPSEKDGLTSGMTIIFKEGLDSWDIGIKDFVDLKEKFAEFKIKYLDLAKPKE